MLSPTTAIASRASSSASRGRCASSPSLAARRQYSPARWAVILVRKLGRLGADRDGVDRDGINAVLEHERAELKTWRKKSPPELPGWLERSGANLH
jgi:hypothetical protein